MRRGCRSSPCRRCRRTTIKEAWGTPGKLIVGIALLQPCCITIRTSPSVGFAQNRKEGSCASQVSDFPTMPAPCSSSRFSRSRDGNACWGRAKPSAEHAVQWRPAERRGQAQRSRRAARGQSRHGGRAARVRCCRRSTECKARGRHGSRPGQTRQSRLPDPDQCGQVASGDDGVRRRHREIPVAGFYRRARLFHAFGELYGLFHEQDLVQQAVGQRSHAPCDLLHQGWTRHPWQLGDEEARPRRFPWLRARFAKKCGNSLPPRRAERPGEYQGGSCRRDARRRGKGGGSAQLLAIATPTLVLGATILRHVVSSVGSGAPAGVQPTRLRLAIASSAGAGSKDPAAITRLGDPLLAAYICNGPSADFPACKPPWIWRAESSPAAWAACTAMADRKPKEQ